MKLKTSIIILLLMIIYSCGNSEEPKNSSSFNLSGSTWIGKRNRDIYLDKKTHYIVLSFHPNKRIFIGKADNNGIVFAYEAQGFYRITDGLIVTSKDRNFKNIIGRTLVYNEYVDTIEGYGVTFYRQR